LNIIDRYFTVESSSWLFFMIYCDIKIIIIITGDFSVVCGVGRLVLMWILSAYPTLESLCLFYTSIVCHLWTTQLFTYLVTGSMRHAFIDLCTFCRMINLPHFEGGTHANGACDPEIRTWAEIFVHCTYPPSFSIFCVIVSSYRVDKQRFCRKHYLARGGCQSMYVLHHLNTIFSHKVVLFQLKVMIKWKWKIPFPPKT